MKKSKKLEYLLNTKIGEFCYPKPNSLKEIGNGFINFEINVKEALKKEIPRLMLIPAPFNFYRYKKLQAKKIREINKKYNENQEEKSNKFGYIFDNEIIPIYAEIAKYIAYIDIGFIIYKSFN